MTREGKEAWGCVIATLIIICSLCFGRFLVGTTRIRDIMGITGFFTLIALPSIIWYFSRKSDSQAKWWCRTRDEIERYAEELENIAVDMDDRSLEDPEESLADYFENIKGEISNLANDIKKFADDLASPS